MTFLQKKVEGEIVVGVNVIFSSIICLLDNWMSFMLGLQEKLFLNTYTSHSLFLRKGSSTRDVILVKGIPEWSDLFTGVIEQ